MNRSILYTAMLLFPAALFVSSAEAQIPNGGFETWSGGNPVGWDTSNDPSFSINITQTSASHSGSSAAHGVVTTGGGGFPWPPTLISGENGRGFAVNARHASVRGWYKLSPIGGDQIFVTVVMSQADSGVGAGATFLAGAQSVYTEFAVDIFYGPSVVPDTCIVSLTLLGQSGGLPNIGSTYDIDDLTFGGPSDVEPSGNNIPARFGLSDNYPNPFNPSTTIPFQIAQSRHVKLGVYDALGREVAVLVDEQLNAGSYRTMFDGSNLSSGVYYYRLQSGNFAQTKKLILLR